MDEEIRPFRPHDEPKPLRVVEPLHFASCHDALCSNGYASTSTTTCRRRGRTMQVPEPGVKHVVLSLSGSTVIDLLVTESAPAMTDEHVYVPGVHRRRRLVVDPASPDSRGIGPAGHLAQLRAPHDRPLRDGAPRGGLGCDLVLVLGRRRARDRLVFRANGGRHDLLPP